MDDDARLGLEFRGSHAPFGCGRCEQHLARLGAGLAHRLVIAPQGLAAGRIEDAFAEIAKCTRIAVVRVVRRHLFDAHAVPVGVEFLREHERQRRHGSLSQFGAAELNRDRVVGADRDPEVRGEFLVAGSLRDCAEHAARADRERQTADALQEAAPRCRALEQVCRFHCPPSPAARSIALTILG